MKRWQSILICMLMVIGLIGNATAQECVTPPVEPNSLLKLTPTEPPVQAQRGLIMATVATDDENAVVKKAVIIVHPQIGVLRFACVIDGVIRDFALNMRTGCWNEMTDTLSEQTKKFLEEKLLDVKSEVPPTGSLQQAI